MQYWGVRCCLGALEHHHTSFVTAWTPCMGPAGGLGGEAAETVAQERAALGSIHALLGALERRQRDAAAAADAQQVFLNLKL